MESEHEASHSRSDSPPGAAEQESHGRGTSWRREDLSEESTAQGTRADVGQSGDGRAGDAPSPGFTHERAPAGSISDAATETSVNEP